MAAGSLAEHHDAHQRSAARVVGPLILARADDFSSVFLALRRHRVAQGSCLQGQPLKRR
jgi:hypothetical protein